MKKEIDQLKDAAEAARGLEVGTVQYSRGTQHGNQLSKKYTFRAEADLLLTRAGRRA